MGMIDPLGESLDALEATLHPASGIIRTQPVDARLAALDAVVSPVVISGMVDPIADRLTALGGSGTLANWILITGIWDDTKLWNDTQVWRDSSGADTTAPVLSLPSGAATGSTTAALSVSTNESGGTLYWAVSTSATPPSVAQIKLGNDSFGSAAAAAGSQSVTATGSQSANAIGLTSSVTYYSYFMQEDSSGNDSLVAAASSFTTSSSTVPRQSMMFTLTTPILVNSASIRQSTLNTSYVNETA